jgi:transcriptional regulator with XRE-family HTH domain
MEVISIVERKVRAHRGLPPPALRRALRESAGLTQSEIGEALGVRRESVSRWEAGLRMPRGDLLIQYAELLESLG